MYGLIGKMTAVTGKRDELVRAMTDGMTTMPGCRSYVIALDPEDPDGIWITEVWENKESHAASLTLPQVKATISVARPLIAGFSHRVETIPVGGHGLSA